MAIGFQTNWTGFCCYFIFVFMLQAFFVLALGIEISVLGELSKKKNCLNVALISRCLILNKGGGVQRCNLCLWPSTDVDALVFDLMLTAPHKCFQKKCGGKQFTFTIQTLTAARKDE